SDERSTRSGARARLRARARAPARAITTRGGGATPRAGAGRVAIRARPACPAPTGDARRETPAGPARRVRSGPSTAAPPTTGRDHQGRGVLLPAPGAESPARRDRPATALAGLEALGLPGPRDLLLAGRAVAHEAVDGRAAARPSAAALRLRAGRDR